MARKRHGRKPSTRPIGSGAAPAEAGAPAGAPTAAPDALRHSAGCIAGVFPECNPLMPLWHDAEGSPAPAAKSIPVRLRAMQVQA